MRKNKNKFNALKTAFVIFCTVMLFFWGSYAYLDINLKNSQAPADVKDYTVPYESTPENCGIMFLMPSDKGLLINLDFSSEEIQLIAIEEPDDKNNVYYGYQTNYTLNADYPLIEGIIDRIGGIEISGFRYTGVQITELISNTNQNELNRDIIIAVFKQISKKGFSKSDFLYIIENSDTDLTVPDCFDWHEQIADMSLRVSFVN